MNQRGLVAVRACGVVRGRGARGAGAVACVCHGTRARARACMQGLLVLLALAAVLSAVPTGASDSELWAVRPCRDDKNESLLINWAELFGFSAGGSWTVVGEGAKNVVLAAPGNSSFVLRISLLHRGSCVAVVDHGAVADMYGAMLLRAGNGTWLATALRHLRTASSAVGHRGKDIVPYEMIGLECLRASEMSASGGLVFAVHQIVMSTQIVCVGELGRVVAVNAASDGRQCNLTLPLQLNVDLSRRYTGTIYDLADRPEEYASALRPVHVFVLAYGYFHDMLRVFDVMQWVPLDNASDNGNITFTWSDFGTTNEQNGTRATAQLKTSVAEMLRTTEKMANFVQSELAVELLRGLSPPLCSMSLGDGVRTYLASQLAIVDAFIEEKLDAPSRFEIRILLGPPSRSFVSRIADEQQTTAAELLKQGTTITEQGEKITEQGTTITEQGEKITEQGNAITELGDTITDLKAAVYMLTSKLRKLTADSQHVHSYDNHTVPPD
jgi:hypothetical protein